MAPKFKRTYTAAQVEMQSTWELVSAIAEDAVESDVPISGIESCLGAKTALEAAGNEYKDNTVKALCVLAKFDMESTARQQRVWRRYGWTTVYVAASAGWAQEAVYDLLLGDHKTFREVQKAVHRKEAGHAHVPSLDVRWAKWLTKFGALIEEGAELAEETESTPGVVLGGYGQLGHLMYDRAVSDGIDAEYRELVAEA